MADGDFDGTSRSPFTGDGPWKKNSDHAQLRNCNRSHLTLPWYPKDTSEQHWYTLYHRYIAGKGRLIAEVTMSDWGADIFELWGKKQELLLVIWWLWKEGRRITDEQLLSWRCLKICRLYNLHCRVYTQATIAETGAVGWLTTHIWTENIYPQTTKVVHWWSFSVCGWYIIIDNSTYMNVEVDYSFCGQDVRAAGKRVLVILAASGFCSSSEECTARSCFSSNWQRNQK